GATPFAKAAPPAPPPAARPPSVMPPSVPPASPRELTIEQYASLSAELSLSPEQAPAILAKYGIPSVEERRALDRAWGVRFAADSELQNRWQALQAHYRQWLLARR